MNNSTLWLKGIKNKALPSLKKDIDTDILIIGGGITGITTAFYLKNEKLDITLIDSNKIGYGVTARTTGKLTYLQENVLNKIKNVYNTDIAIKYINSQKYAMDLVKNNIITHNIKCNFESNSSYVFTNQENNIYQIKEIEKILSYANINHKVSTTLPIKYPCKYAVKIIDSAVFHPVKYVLALKEVCLENGIHLYENTRAIDIKQLDDEYIVTTSNNIIKAKKVVLACHYPFKVTQGFIPFKTYIEKSYVVSGVTNKNKMFNAISYSDTHSIRYHSDSKDYIIYAGLSNTLSNNVDNEKNYNELLWHMKSNLCTDIKYYWFNQDIITADGLPLIGYVEKDNPNLLMGTGYNTWGMTNGTLAGKILSDLIKGKNNKYLELVEPNRPFNISKLVNLVGSNFDNGISYIASKIKKDYSFYKSNVKTIVKDGVKYGVYTDDDGKEHIVHNLCPHMKCNLIFNEVDKTWDCPCHSSRFTIDGKVIKGPSTYDISVKQDL